MPMPGTLLHINLANLSVFRSVQLKERKGNREAKNKIRNKENKEKASRL